MEEKFKNKIRILEETKFKEKLLYVKEAIEDWERGKLSSFSAIVAINIILDERKPSKEFIEWAMKSTNMNTSNA